MRKLNDFLVISVVLLSTFSCIAAASDTKIAFVSARDGSQEVYVMNADGTNPTRLTNNNAADDLEISWSPDGTKIAFRSKRDGNNEIYVMNADGTDQVNLTNHPMSDYGVSWSPDGTKIAFNSNRDGGEWEIYVMNADGTDQTRLTNNTVADEYPSWSPDGTKIAFSSTRNRNNDVYVMNADGTDQVNLTNHLADDGWASWSPDGTKIAFGSTRDGNWEIYVMNADGTNPTRLTNNAADDYNPSWSPDGTQIAFNSNRDGNGEIYVMNADGTNLTNLTNNTAYDWTPSWSPSFPSMYDGPIWYASTTGDDNAGDGSESNPFKTIQKGIDAASDGDTVLVADGTYTGEGNKDLDFKGKAITVTSVNGAGSTIIDCEGDSRGFYFHSGETEESMVSGFKIINGSVTDGYGGGIYCENSSSPTIANNIITENSAGYGGGIYSGDASSPRIRNNKIIKNSATKFGGGIQCRYSSSPTIQNNEINENTAADEGGGIHCNNSSSTIQNNEIIGNAAREGGGIYCIYSDSGPTIINNTIDGNSAGYNGGGVYCDRCSPEIQNNKIIWNSAGYSGGGIYCYAASPTIINNTINENSASTYYGGGIYCNSSSSPTVLNTILWRDSPDEICVADGSSKIKTTYSVVQGGWEGEGNIDAAPLFIDQANGDYHLSDDSPCIGAGTSEDAPKTDIEGNPRPNPAGSNPDMGAYESSRGEPAPPIQPPVLIPYELDPTNDTTPTLDWQDVPNASAYHIQIDDNFDFSSPIADDDSLTESQYTPGSPLTEGKIYWRVSSIDGDGKESDFSSVDDFTIDITPPAVPSGLQVIAGNGQVSLSWNANTQVDLSHYQIYRSTTGGFTPTQSNLIDKVDKPDTTFIDTGLTNETRYYYRISAVDNAGNESEFSDEVNATPFSQRMPIAKITYPTDDACLHEEVRIIGTAEGGSEGLRSWMLKRAFEDGQFITIADGSAPISDGELTCWDTTKEVDGTYTLKLKVTDKEFNKSVDEIVVTVDNTEPHPNIVLTSLGAEGDYTKSNTSLSVSGQTEAGAVIISAQLIWCEHPVIIKDVASDIDIDEYGRITGTFTVGDLSGIPDLRLKLCVRDCAGNEGCGESHCLAVDDEMPQVRILTPANCAYFNWLPIRIAGVAQDGISGVAKVEIDGGSGWIEANGTTNWSVDFYAPDVDVLYTINARVYDRAGNLYEPQSGTSAIGVKYYPGSPAANISAPADDSEVSCAVNVYGSIADSDVDPSDLGWALSVMTGVSAACSEQPCSGTVIASGNSPIYEGLLARWDTRGIIEGTYTLCLTVKNNFTQVHVRRTNINVVKKGICIDIGDVNGDGKIAAYDASLVLRYIVGLIELSPDQQGAADVTGDGTVSSLDAALILRHTVGLIHSFPVEDKNVAPSINIRGNIAKTDFSQSKR